MLPGPAGDLAVVLQITGIFPSCVSQLETPLECRPGLHTRQNLLPSPAPSCSLASPSPELSSLFEMTVLAALVDCKFHKGWDPPVWPTALSPWNSAQHLVDTQCETTPNSLRAGPCLTLLRIPSGPYHAIRDMRTDVL